MYVYIVYVHAIYICEEPPTSPPLLRLRDPRSAEAGTELTQTRC